MISALLLTAAFGIILSACGSTAPESKSIEQATATRQISSNSETVKAVETSASAKATSAGTPAQSASTASADKTGGTLVAYFSCTGNTKGVAETIAEITGGTLYEITPAQPYTDADLNYNDNSSRSTKEQNDKSARPEISGTVENWDQYNTVFLGYPIWWGEEPRILDTFAESNDFTGKTVIPFCTSGGSGIGSSGKNLSGLSSGSGKWLEGKRFNNGVSAKDISDWLSKLGIR